jgi:hypothetical protein
MSVKTIMAFLFFFSAAGAASVFAGAQSTQTVTFEQTDKNDNGTVENNDDADNDGVPDPVEVKAPLKDGQNDTAEQQVDEKK